MNAFPQDAQKGRPVRPFQSLYLFLGEPARLPFTARIERAHSYRARSASKKGTWPLPPLLADVFTILLGDFHTVQNIAHFLYQGMG